MKKFDELNRRVKAIEKKNNSLELKGETFKKMNEVKPKEWNTQKRCIKAVRELFFEN